MLILRLASVVGFLLLLAVFFNQNTGAQVVLHFMGMETGAISVPISLITAFLAGVVLGGVLGAPGNVRLRLALRRERKESVRARQEADDNRSVSTEELS